MSIRLNDIIDAMIQRHPQEDVDLLYKAYVYSAKVHQGQIRKSGEAYLTHPIAVAHQLALMGMDSQTIAAGLLHDTVEDTWATQDDVEDNFGPEVAALVAGVTKLSQFEIQSKQKRQIESFRKLILASITDPRVIVVKLADRLHNMQTLGVMRAEKRERIAYETLNIYAPIAHRLGMQSVADDLEDLSFAAIDPDEYERIRAFRETVVEQSAEEQEQVIASLSEVVATNEIAHEIAGRIKHIYSIHKKMQREAVELRDVYDLIAYRIVVDTVADCYAVLGIVHALWRPVQGRFKDYIAVPKINGYQSLHTTVFGENQTLLEIQVRTTQMHRFAEQGIAAHWAYKEGSNAPLAQIEYFRTMRQMLDATDGTDRAGDFFDTVKEKLRAGHIIVFTPKGDTVELPDGATALDFAFKIHSEVGLHCSGAIVNGRWVPIRQELGPGDVVSVQTKASSVPSSDWLQIATTSSAKSKIRSFLKEREDEESERQGKALFVRALKNELGRKTVKDEEWEPLLRALGVSTEAQLYKRLGSGQMTPGTVREKLKVGSGDGRESVRGFVPESLTRLFKRVQSDKPDILVAGDSGYMLRLAKCCRPLEGDEIGGYITRGRGITIHRASCEVLARADASRILTAKWQEESRDSTPDHPVRIRVLLDHSPGSLAAISQTIAKTGVNIAQTNVTSTEQHAEGIFVLLVRNREQLDRLFAALEKLKVVSSVERIG